MVNAITIIAAFSGGVLGAMIGGTQAFVMTGIFAILAGCLNVAGLSEAGGLVATWVAFGPFFGPHIAFASSAAAAGYAKRRGYIPNGADCNYGLCGIMKPDVLLVSGVFGVCGHLIKELVAGNLFGGAYLDGRLVTDHPGITVFLLGVVARVIFGGKLRTGDKLFPKGGELGNAMVMGLFLSALVACAFGAVVTFGGVEAGLALSLGYNIICFGIAAVGLTFALMGHPFYACHHIFILTAEAVVQAWMCTGNIVTAMVCATIVGFISNILFEFWNKLGNSGQDSHIDGPAFAIFIMTFVINAIWPATAYIL